jgi:hypothetical protein
VPVKGHLRPIRHLRAHLGGRFRRIRSAWCCAGTSIKKMGAGQGSALMHSARDMAYPLLIF